MTSLNPVLTVGGQIAETLRLHQHLGRKAVAERRVDMLSLVGIAEPRRRAGETWLRVCRGSPSRTW